MKKLQNVLCIFMCAVLYIGMTVPAFADGAPAASVKGGDPLSGIAASNYNVWRYESNETLDGVSAVINAYVTKDGTRTTEMKYTTDPTYGVKCAATVCEPVGGALGLGDHRITTAFKGTNKLTVDFNFVAVTYLTTASGEYGLTFRNTGGPGSVVLTENTSVSEGKWVTVYAPVGDTAKNDIVARMNKSYGNMGLMWDGANGADDTLYVREIVFFANEDDVLAYREAASMCYNGEAYVAPKIPVKDEPTEETETETEILIPEEETVTIGDMIRRGNVIVSDSYNPFDVIDSKNYSIWCYESKETLAAVSAIMNSTSSGESKFVTEPKTGVGCIAAVYDTAMENRYRIQTAFYGGANKLGIDDLNYIAVTYMTDNTGKFSLSWRNTGGPGGVTLTDDTSVSNGKWVTAMVKAEGENKANIMARLNKSFGNMRLVWGCQNKGQQIYVREIVFFKNEADATVYTEVAPAYYNGEKVMKPVEKSEERLKKLMLISGAMAAIRGAGWTLENMKKTTAPLEWIEYAALFDMRSAEALGETGVLATETGAVTYITEKNKESAKLEFTPGNSELGYYRVSVVPTANGGVDVNSGDYYAAVTYRANKEASLTLMAGDDSIILEESTVSSEKWQSVCVNIEANSDILEAIASGNGTVTLGWGHNAPNGSVEIKELVIFGDKTAAEDYETYAPIYYNELINWKPKDPLKEIDNKIVVSFESVKQLQKMLLLRDSADAAFCSELVEVEKGGIPAISLSGGATSVSNYRRFQFVTQPSLKLALTNDTQGDVYAAVTVMADGEGDLWFRANNTGAYGGFSFGTTAVSDKWQTLVCPEAVGEALLNLLKTDYNNKIAIEWQNADQSKSIIIKEVVFFDREADAKKYGETAAEYYNVESGYEKIDAPDDLAAPEAPLSGISKYDKWTYASAESLTSDGASLNRNAMADASVFTKDPNFGVKSLKLKYSTKSNVNTYWSQTQFNIGGNKLLVAPNYIAVTYLTSDTAPASIGFNTMTSGGSGVIVGDTSSSNGRWTAGYLALTEEQISAVAARLSGGGKALAINWSNTNTNSEIYIREVVFFENEADAQAYAKKAPAYYNYAEDYSWNVDPLTLNYEGEKVIWSYTSASIGANGAHIKSGASIVADPITGVTSAKVTAANFECRYNAANRFTIANPNYVAVTYMTPDEGQYSLFWAYINGSHTQSQNLSASNGRWVTEYVKLTDAQITGLKTRLNKAPGGNHVIMQVLDGGTAIIPANLYVRDIIFFENEDDVKAYAKQAQIYYNYYSK